MSLLLLWSAIAIAGRASDTVYVRIKDPLPAGAVRRLVQELRIAPEADDTSLFTQVFDFEVDRVNRIWVYDVPSHSLLLFDTAGKLVRRIGRDGAGPGEFRSNNGMVALPDSGIAVWDSRNARVSFFTKSGDFSTSWLTPSGFSTNNGLLTDRSGAFFLKRPVTPPREGEILGRMGLVRLKANGVLGDSLAAPDMPVPREVYIATNKGSRSSTNAPFAPSYLWAWHTDGHFVVGHGGNYEIVIARPGRPPLAIVREARRVPLSNEERDEQRAFITWNLRHTDPGWTWTGPAIPANKAPLSELFIGRDGTIWARVAQPSERIPVDELAEPRDKTMPVGHFRTPPAYEVFSPEGRFLGSVTLPPRSRLIEADAGTAWLLDRTEDDLPAVVRFRIEPRLR